MTTLKSRAYHALRQSEAYFKTDMVYAAKGGLWTSLRFLVGLLATVATTVAFGNLLPRETYGTYSYLISLGASLSFLTLSGIGPAVTRAVARGFEAVVPAALRLQLKYNLVAMLTVSTVALYYGFKGNRVFGFALLMLAFAFPVAEALHIYEPVLMGKRRFDILAKMTSIISIVAAASTVLTLLFTNNILVLIGVFSAMTLVPNIFAYRWATRNLKKEEPDPEAIIEMRRTAFHITGAGIIGTLASYIDKIILFQVAGPASLAVYGFAIAGPERLKGLLKNWISIALPRLAERSIDEIRAVFYKRIALSLLIGAGLSLVYIFLAPILFKLLLPKYLDSILYSQAYSLGLLLIPALVYIGNIFYSQNMLRAIYISSTGIQLLRIALFLVFGWLYGTWGLIGAYLLTQALSALYCIWVWEMESRRLRNI